MFICPLRGKRRRPQLVMQSDGASVVGPWEASWAAAGVPDNEEGKQEVLRKGTDMAGDEHDFEGRSRAAQAKAAHALDRLLKLAETRDSGQIRRVARFIAALYNGDAYPLDLFELRAVDVAISDDVINCIDALRWGRADLYKLVPDGQKRIEAVIRDWGVAPPEPLVPRDCADLNARLVTYGDAPGYRDVTLRFAAPSLRMTAVNSRVWPVGTVPKSSEVGVRMPVGCGVSKLAPRKASGVDGVAGSLALINTSAESTPATCGR